MTNLKQYFAKGDDEVLAKNLTAKIEEYERFLDSTGRLELIRQSYQFFYNQQIGNTLTKSGTSGEILKVSVNHYRAFLNGVHIAVSNTRPDFKSEAATTDYEAQSQCLLSDSIIQHYLEEEGMEAQLIQAPLSALIDGEVFQEVDWDENTGEIVAIDPTNGNPVYSGCPRMRMHSGLAVTRDVNLRDGDKFQWVCIRSYENKWQIAGQYPKHADHILAATQTPRNIDKIFEKIRVMADQNSDLIEVYRFYHNPMQGLLPQGKQAVMVGGRVLEQAPLTKNYSRIPVERLACMQMEGSLLPYSQAWDLIPLMQASNILMTAAVSNAINLALTSLWTPMGTENNFSMKQLAGGFTHIQSAVKPEPLMLAGSSPEVWNTYNQLQNNAQLLIGANAVSRGDLANAAQLKSGTALATMLASAVQVQNQLSQRWRKFCEGSVNLLIETLQKNAKAPLLISIAGRNQGATLKAFSSKEIAMVRRVRASMVSPILNTQAGKLELANNLLQQFPTLMDPTKYINVLTSGRIEGLISPTYDQNMALLAEAEAIRQGRAIKPLLLERHDLFIKENLKLISTPEAKEDDDLVERVRQVILQRLDLWQQLETDPQLAVLVGISPIPPAQPPAPPEANQVPKGSDPLQDPSLNAADPSNLPKEADPSLQAAYEQTGLPQ